MRKNHMRLHFSKIIQTIALISFVLSLLPAISHPADKSSFNFANVGKVTTIFGLRQIQQGYNFRVWMSNDLVIGRSACSGQQVPITTCAVGIGCEYPLGSCFEHLFGAGPWIGGLINGVRYVTEAYNGDVSDSETLPDPNYLTRDRLWVTSISDSMYDAAISGYYKYSMNRRNYDDDGDGRIDEDELDGIDNDGDWVQATDDIGMDGLPDSLEVGCKGIYDPIHNPDPAYDSYNPSAYDSCHPYYLDYCGLKDNKNHYTEKNGLPDHGEPHVDEDYGAVSDHDVYVTSSDTSSINKPNRHHAMGITMYQKSYAWNRKEANSILPIEYYFINIGKNIIRDVYVAFFADMDIGPVSNSQYYQNNYAALFPDLHTGYIYNAEDRGSTPLGVTILEAPKPFTELKNIWQWFDFTTRYSPGTEDSTLYAWMSGEKGLIYPDQPATNPSDTRFFYSFGPIATWNPGDTLRMTIALVTGNCFDLCDSSLKDNAINAIRLYRRGFHLPPNVFSPRLKLTGGFRKLLVEWGPGFDYYPWSVWDDSNKTAESFPPTHWRRRNPPRGHTRGGRIFEGYRLYRSEYPSGDPSTFSLLAQYDIEDDWFGYNVGLDSTYVDSNLTIGKTYWYAVTSYSIPDMLLLEEPGFSDSVRYDTVYAGEQESSILENRRMVVATRAYGMNSYPPTFKLYEAFPNPFNPSTLIMYDLPQEANVSLKIYNTLGQEVVTLVNTTQQPGSYEVPWNGVNSIGQKVASGLYFYRVIANSGTESFMQTSKLLLTK
jgi:hypothetical protein